VHQLLAELVDCDWVLVEGFKRADLLKIEVWRADVAKPVLYPDDPFIVAVATDRADLLPAATGLPILDLNAPDSIAAFLMASSSRHEYTPPEDWLADADPRRGAGPAAAGGQPAG
jgi:molybdopterin-guanine dinucleotide biosynthesis protein B